MGRKQAMSSVWPLKTPGWVMIVPSSLLDLKASLMVSSCLARRVLRVGVGGAVGVVVVDITEVVVLEF